MVLSLTFSSYVCKQMDLNRLLRCTATFALILWLVLDCKVMANEDVLAPGSHTPSARCIKQKNVQKSKVLKLHSKSGCMPTFS